MNGTRQQIQYSLALEQADQGEAPGSSHQGAEPFMAKPAPESSAVTEQLMEEVCNRENLVRAWKRARSNKGSPGVDGMTIEDAKDYLGEHWPSIRSQLLEGTYQPQPVKRVEIPKPEGGVRKLGVPCVVDRLIQQALLQVLQERWDPTFSEHSYGFRPGRSAHQAVAQAQRYIAAGYAVVVDLDLEKFFDRVNHDGLMARVAARVSDKRVLKLIRAFLKAGVMEDGLVSPVDEGTPQGGPLSPLLSNLVRDDLATELPRRGLRFCRYADDCNIYVRSRRAGERVMASVSRFLTNKLKLRVCDRGNLVRAWKRVRSNKGSPGVDGMTIEGAKAYLREHWPNIRSQLLSGTYQPQPVKRCEIPKPDGGIRKLGVPCVVDRLIQQAVLQVLQERWDPTFSEHSYGFRPGRSAHQAVAQAQRYVAQGYSVVVDLDLEKFFDRVNHDALMARVAARVSDKRVLKLIRAFLKAGVMEDGLVRPGEGGTQQGGPVSPLLSNLVLDDLDKELTRRGLRFCRYADDCNIYVRSRRAGERVMASVSRFLTNKLKLKVNEAKSAVAPPEERKFLGFSIANDGSERRIAPKALAKFKAQIREMTRRTRGNSLPKVIEDLAPYLLGWRGYFVFCQTPRVLTHLEAWIRRRLRAYLWRQWQNGPNRFKELRQRGLPKFHAAVAAGSPTGFWRMSGHPAVQKALRNAYFHGLGLPRLYVPAHA